MKKSMMTILLMLSPHSYGTEHIKPGLYKSKNCFVNVKYISRDSLHLRFEHRSHYPDVKDNDFTPKKILGHNLIYNPNSLEVDYLPSSCNFSSIEEIKIKWNQDLLKIKCGHLFQDTRVKLKVFINQEREIKKLIFYKRESSKESSSKYVRYSCKKLNIL